MEKQVSKLQLDTLVQFIKAKGVKHYDIQLEIADHFASAIEDEWQNNPDLVLEEEMVNLYQEFKDPKFKKLIATKGRALQRKWLGRCWKHFKGFFTLPKLVITIAMILGFQAVFNAAANPLQIFKFCAFLVILTSFATFVFLLWKKPVKVPIFAYDHAQVQLLNAMNLSGLAFIYSADWLVQSFFPSLGMETWGLAIYMSISLLFFYCMIIHVSQKNYEDFQRMYASLPPAIN
ncbi:MAG: hypothetical protein HRU41_18060 [Saprospiraceae bacterium]|nr:hypothetical protein [Saprospiraceae bacterium]